MARTIPPADETAAFEELAVIVQELPRFALVFAICASIEAALEHMSRYKNLHPLSRISSVELTWPDGRIYARLGEVYEKEKPNAIFVSGMDFWTEHGEDARGNEFTVGLNHGRDFIHDTVHCPVVFWCTQTVYNHIRRNAHDFFSIATATLRVSKPVGEEETQARYRYVTPINTLQLLGSAERNRQITEVKSLLCNIGSSSSDVEEQFRLLRYLGLLFCAEATYAEARATIEKALRLSKDGKATDLFKQSTLLDILAHIEFMLGNNTTAKSLYLKVLSMQKMTVGHLHTSTANTLHNIGVIESHDGDDEQAKDLLAQSLAIKQTTLGMEHPETQATLLALAQIELSLGKYDSAREMYEKILAAQERTLGRQHPQVAFTLKGLGAIEIKKGHYGLAKSLCEQALAIDEATVGHWSLATADTLDLLATIAANAGNPKEAQSLWQQASSIRDEVMGKASANPSPTYPASQIALSLTKTATARNNLKVAVNSDSRVPVSALLTHRPFKKRKTK